MSDAVDKQIEGVCEEISEKNGWTSFAINVGSQYPVRLSTKLPALIEAGRAAGQERAVWKFKESQGGENPNKPGTFYTNRYFDGVEVGGTVSENPPAASASGGATSSSEPARPAYNPGQKDHAITRMAVLKAAAEIVAAQTTAGMFGPDVDPGADTIALAARFETWVNRDIDSIPFG